MKLNRFKFHEDNSIKYIDSTTQNSGVETTSSTLKLEDCPSCFGKTELQSNNCPICLGSKKLFDLSLSILPITKEDKDSQYSFFDNDLIGSKQQGESFSISDIGIRSNDPKHRNNTPSDREAEGTPGSNKDVGKENEGGGPKEKKKGCLWQLLKFLLFLLLAWLLLKGCEMHEQSERKKEKAEKEKVDKEKKKKKKKKIKKSVKKKQSPNQNFEKRKGSGDEYDFDPIKMWEQHANISYQSLATNQGLNNFMQKNLKRGKRKENLKKMSEKGVFQLCRDFGAFEQECKNKWFKNKKYRQTFVKRIENLYQQNGENPFE